MTTTQANRTLAGFAAGCAERALAYVTNLECDPRATRALSLARAWADQAASDDECLEAAFAAQQASREAHASGNLALATALQAAATAAGSLGNLDLTRQAAALAIEAISLASAGCEQPAAVTKERHAQWQDLGSQADLLFEAEPPSPEDPACRPTLG